MQAGKQERCVRTIVRPGLGRSGPLPWETAKPEPEPRFLTERPCGSPNGGRKRRGRRRCYRLATTPPLATVTHGESGESSSPGFSLLRSPGISLDDPSLVLLISGSGVRVPGGPFFKSSSCTRLSAHRQFAHRLVTERGLGAVPGLDIVSHEPSLLNGERGHAA
jgi:hypothetical protein